MLPVLRNTITGLEGIDPAVTEAARGVGMTPRQSLTMVELPLALPVIMAGIRTAAVWVIGTATLSTPIGQTSLGNYIFTGLQTQNWVFVLFGCVAAALLALAVDQLLALMETGVARRSRRRIAFGAIGLVSLLAACAPAVAGAAGRRLRRRRETVLRAIRPRRADPAAAARRRARGRPSRRARLRRHLRCAQGRRDRRLCGIHRHDLGQSDAAQRREAARRGAARGHGLAEGAARHHGRGRARLRECLCAGDVGASARRRSACARSPISCGTRRR